MPPNLIVISDIHGCYRTLLRLLDKCPRTHTPVFAGDLIDRGPHSRQVVEFAIRHQIPTVAGNHEDLMLVSRGLQTAAHDKDAWYYNGALQTLESYPSGKSLQRHIKWINVLPLFIHYPGLLVSHTGHGLNPHRTNAVWDRHMEFPDDGLFRIFGHTPRKEPVVTATYANIDTGAAYKSRGYGKLTAMLWPEKMIVQQDHDETPYASVRYPV